MLPTEIELEAERLRRSLRNFVRAAWPVLEPGTPFASNWHIDAICDYLEGVARGEVRRLLINVPPRHTKSLLVSVMFLAWVWASAPERRFLHASYAERLALRDSSNTRRLIESPWYRERYGHVFSLTDDQNEKARFVNDKSGYRIATSVGGFATGEGGDVVVIDDPHKIDDAASDSARERTVDWFTSTMITRLNQPSEGAFVLVGQRVHESDLFGALLEDGSWQHLCLPAEYEPSHPFLWPRDPRTEPGELLWPERFPAEEIERLKRGLRSYGASAQLQQLPTPATGGIFERSWWRFYGPEELPELERIVQSWDLTYGDGLNADYVVGQAWGKAGPNRYLLAQRRERLGFTATLKAIKDLKAEIRRRFPKHFGGPILVEKAANGAAAIDVLSKEIGAVLPVRPQGSKEVRAHAISPQIEAGNVFLPGAPNGDNTGYDRLRTPAWVQGFVEEAAAFPRGAHDDQVDAMTQAFPRLERTRPRVRRVR